MKRKVKTRKTGKKSREDTISTLLEGSLSKFFFFDKEHESHQEKEPLCSLPELYFSQKGYSLRATLRLIAHELRNEVVEELIVGRVGINHPELDIA